MARIPWILGFLVLICASRFLHGSASIRPISDAHRSAALELFASADGSYASLEKSYEALRTFQMLGLEKVADISPATCPIVAEILGSLSSAAKELFQALRVNSILKCQIDVKTIERAVSKLQDGVKTAESLLDFYYTVGSLVHIKNQGFDVILSDVDSVFHSIKALSQSDGRWRYDSSGAESSTYAAGIALQTLAGVVSLADSEVDQSTIGVAKKDILKLLDSIKSYNDGALYFEEKHVDMKVYKGPLTTTASVVRGITAFAAVASGKLTIPGDKILGLAKFFLSIGIPGSSKDLFDQIDSLSCLENNRVSTPLILSLPSTVFSLTSRDQLKVEVTTVFGSSAPPLTVTLVEASISDSRNTPALENQVLQYDQENNIHYLDTPSLKLDVGKYTFVFEISLEDPDLVNAYAIGGETRAFVFITGTIKIDKAEVAILNSDFGSAETTHKLDLAKDNALSLSANHLQKLRLSFQLTTPLGHGFKPHQVLLKLRHESKLEHIFILEHSARQFKIVLDFLSLVEKFYYLSGKYDIELTVGDIAMENSFLRALGYVELDLPEAPEKVARTPQTVDPYLRFGPKQEISHIFRLPEKRPPKELSYTFFGLTLLPLVGFLIGLMRLGINLKGFPSSALPATFSVLFHSGIAAILLLYALFWLKLNLFTTLKVLGFLGAFLIFVGHRTLSYLASSSAKQKSS
ncbi:dolichyl-diphosphooligosaccharide--protein glycosyltransferase subunit 2-like [Asparagus officinalis]|uniref:dolichyl-diphosphooligosaccharide--protein glycosyltransferase subunit 2-like n=1 Tax=Asparagus officinalis TaxID=4686 RepID=UPI00098E1D92|nr:dolichyl-diphosphooligosaccharide--protein glycosyltransferase subunit 2-like [Asparagus officinalis]